MPPHNAIMGNLLAAKTAADELPPGAHSTYIINRLLAKYGRNGICYIDMSPVMVPMVVLSDPYLIKQALQHRITTQEKPTALYDWFHPITNGPSLFTQNGEEWKYHHNLFLPFFSNSNLDAAIPMIVGQIAIYREKLKEAAASGQMCFLEPLTLSLMNDIIGVLVFNAKLDVQKTGSHPLVDIMLRQLHLKFAANNV